MRKCHLKKDHSHRSRKTRAEQWGLLLKIMRRQYLRDFFLCRGEHSSSRRILQLNDTAYRLNPSLEKNIFSSENAWNNTVVFSYGYYIREDMIEFALFFFFSLVFSFFFFRFYANEPFTGIHDNLLVRTIANIITLMRHLENILN